MSKGKIKVYAINYKLNKSNWIYGGTMRLTTFTFLILSVLAINIYPQPEDFIIIEIQHKGDDRLGMEFIENMKALIDEAPQYKLWTNEQERFQIFISTLDPLKSEKMEPADKLAHLPFSHSS
jgi:hypothetical protein